MDFLIHPLTVLPYFKLLLVGGFVTTFLHYSTVMEFDFENCVGTRGGALEDTF